MSDEDRIFEDEVDDDQKEQNFKQLRAELKAARERAEVLERQQAEAAAAQRAAQVTAALTQAGLSEKLAKHFPEDASLETVTEWAQAEFGLVPQKEQRQMEVEESPMDRYNRAIAEAYNPGKGGSEQGLLDQVTADTEKALNNKFKPTDEEIENARKPDRQINEINRRMEKQVQLGRIPAPDGGIQPFGGLLNPPPYADRTREAG